MVLLIRRLTKKIYLLILLSFLLSCTNANQSEENLKKLDKLYGYCDNPHRGIFGRQYEICKAKEDAAGPDGTVGESKSIGEIFNSITGKGIGNQSVVYINSVNRELWFGATEVLSTYPIKIAQSDIGYIETDWLYDMKEPDKRCLVKVQISSNELISTGVNTKIICQLKANDNWYQEEKNYAEESKQLTLSILTAATKLKSEIQ